jgi:glutathione reductase (NADPH)
MKNVLAGRNERALYKMVVNSGDRCQIVGLHMIGPDAPEILQAAAIAVKAGLTKSGFRPDRRAASEHGGGTWCCCGRR